jgi:hypothetical protein
MGRALAEHLRMSVNGEEETAPRDAADSKA